MVTNNPLLGSCTKGMRINKFVKVSLFFKWYCNLVLRFNSLSSAFHFLLGIVTRTGSIGSKKMGSCKLSYGLKKMLGYQLMKT